MKSGGQPSRFTRRLPSENASSTRPISRAVRLAGTFSRTRRCTGKNPPCRRTLSSGTVILAAHGGNRTKRG